MQVGSLTPQTFFPFLGGLTGRGSDTALYFHSSQQVAQRKETAIGEHYASRVNRDARLLFSHSIPLLENGADSVFRARTAISSNPDAVTAKAGADAPLANLNVRVIATATSVFIRGDALTSYETAGLPREMYEITIDRGLRSDTIRINTRQTDTNKQVIQKVADAINEADIGISARVSENFTANTARLEIQGIDKSDMLTSSIRDTSGDLLQRLGVTATRQSVNDAGGVVGISGEAIFTVNGKTFYSPTNTAVLFDGSLTFNFPKNNFGMSAEDIYNEWVDNDKQIKNMAAQSERAGGGLLGDYAQTLYLNGTNAYSGSSALVEIRPDTDLIAGSVADFIGSFNSMLNTLSVSPVNTYSSAASFLSGIMSDNSTELAYAGIENSGGGYAMDTEKLKSRLNNDFESVKNLFGGPDGIAGGTMFALKKVLYAPMANFSKLESAMLSSTSLNLSGLLLDTSA